MFLVQILRPVVVGFVVGVGDDGDDVAVADATAMLLFFEVDRRGGGGGHGLVVDDDDSVVPVVCHPFDPERTEVERVEKKMRRRTVY